VQSTRATRILQLGISTQVLQMEDLFVSDPSDHEGVFRALRHGGPLTTEICAALEELYEAGRPNDARSRTVGSSKREGTLATPTDSGDTLATSSDEASTLAGQVADGSASVLLEGDEGSTLAPEREVQPAFPLDAEASEAEASDADTISPEREHEDEGTLSAERDPSGDQTLAPERPGRDRLSHEGQTLAPERDAPPEDAQTLAPERAGRGLAPEENATLAPERPGPPTPEDGATLAPERPGPPAPGEGATLAPERPEQDAAPNDKATLSSERSEAIPARLEHDEEGLVSEDFLAKVRASLGDDGDGSATGGEPSPSEVPPVPVRSRVARLVLLKESSRRLLQDCALTKALSAEGEISEFALRRAAKAAAERNVLFVEHLRQQSIVPREALKAARLQIRPLPVCGHCLMIQPEGHPDEEACISCGEFEHPADSSQARSRSVSSVSAGSSGSGGSTSQRSTSRLASSASERESILTGTSTYSRDGTAESFAGFPGAGGQFAGYELMTRIAEGGMGVVFKARDLNLNRVVALKVMRGGALASRSSRRRFLIEAEAAAALHHENIVKIHQISEVGGYPYYTMDYVEGQVLDKWVEDKSVTPRQIADMLRRVADAVHHFHLRGIIHRDLKPDNVLVDLSAEPRIIDFGIAKKMSVDLDSDASWTVDGEVLGTPHYMPPEQALGKVEEIDTRSDVYALGAILYQLLNEGRPPYHGVRGAANIVLAIQNEDPPPLYMSSAENKELEAIVAKAISKERERRYQSALELAQDLQRFLNNEPILARPASIPYRARKLIRRHPIAASVFVAASLMVSAAVTWNAFERAEHDREVALRLAEARLEPLERRAQAFTEVLGFDPGNPLVIVERDMAAIAHERQQDHIRQEAALERERERRASELKIAEEKRRRDVAEANLKEQQALSQQRLLEEAERERKKAEAELQGRNENRARELLKKARAAKDRLLAFSALSDALVLVPESRGALGAELALSKLELCLGLAGEALAQDQVGLARFWIQEASKLNAARERLEPLAKLRADVERRSNGLEELEEARNAIQRSQWRVARERLSQARRRGVRDEVLQDEERLVQARCREAGQAILTKGRTFFEGGQFAEALTQARKAKVFLKAPLDPRAADDLISRCAVALRRSAQTAAWRSWREPERRSAAVQELRRVADQLKDQPETYRLLEREATLRALWLEDRALSKQVVLLPEHPELEVGPLFAGRFEVSNGEFKSFVDDKGYQDDALWDREALPLRRRFVDSTPGAPQPGPRTWLQGSYGDTGNRDRPVAGITFWEARAYAAWLSRKTGARWRLPSEREWRVLGAYDPATGNLQSFPWGDEFRPEHLPRLSQARLVGSNSADSSPLGVHDLGGNLAEWVVLPDDRPAVKGAAFAFGARVAEHFANLQTTGTPGPTPPPEALAAIGFRLVREVPQ